MGSLPRLWSHHYLLISLRGCLITEKHWPLHAAAPCCHAPSRHRELSPPLRSARLPYSEAGITTCIFVITISYIVDTTILLAKNVHLGQTSVCVFVITISYIVVISYGVPARQISPSARTSEGRPRRPEKLSPPAKFAFPPPPKLTKLRATRWAAKSLRTA